MKGMAIMKNVAATLLVAYLFHIMNATSAVQLDIAHNATEDNDTMNLMLQLDIVHNATEDNDMMNLMPQLDIAPNATEDNDMMNLMPQGDEPQGDAGASEYAKRVIEDIKARILKNLNLKEPPKRHASLSPLQTLNFRNDSDVSSEVTNATADPSERIRPEFVYATIENHTDSDGSWVWFYFDLPQQVVNKDFESAELWLHKKEDVTEFSLSWVIANTNETLTAAVRNQEASEDWIRFNVSRMLHTENISSLDLKIASEDGQWGLDFEEGLKPFLIIRTEDRAISKRSLNCPADNSSCCRDRFMVSFAEAGWSDWVVEPKKFDAKICKGNCTDNYGLPWKHHGRIMLMLCQKNPAIAATIKYFRNQRECVSCHPIEFQPTSFIYLAENGTQVLQYMDGMVISKCGCL